MTGVQPLSLRVQGVLAEAELVSGKVAMLDTGTGKVSEAEAGAGVVMIARCGGLEVRQRCETEGRSQDGATYCATFSRELSVCGASNNSVRGAH